MIGRAIEIGGKPWTIIGYAWGNYYYLANPDEEEVIVRNIGLITRAIELGAEVDPNAELRAEG